MYIFPFANRNMKWVKLKMLVRFFLEMTIKLSGKQQFLELLNRIL